MRRREVLTGTRGRVHTTLPSHLRKSTNVAAEGLLPDRALLSSTGGFTELPWIKGGSRGQERGRCRTYARSKGYEAETISQPLSWRQDMIQRIHVDNPHVWQEPPGAVGQVLLQLVVARREEGRQCRIVWEWIEGRGDGAEVQSARAYTDIQHLTMGNASPLERAAES